VNRLKFLFIYANSVLKKNSMSNDTAMTGMMALLLIRFIRLMLNRLFKKNPMRERIKKLNMGINTCKDTILTQPFATLRTYSASAGELVGQLFMSTTKNTSSITVAGM